MNEDMDRIEGLDRLARSAAPARDLWPGIRARLKPRRSRYPYFQLALAASLVAGLATVFTLSPRQEAPGEFERVHITGHSRAIVQANLSIVDQAEKQLRQALKKHPDSEPLRSLLESTQHRATDLRAML